MIHDIPGHTLQNVFGVELCRRLRVCARLSVVAVRDGLPGPAVWLVPRRSPSDGELKTYLCNAPADIPQQRLVRTSGMRWPIESRFEVSKQELGMGDDEVRSWRGWHHHMTLVFLTLALLARLQGRFKKRASADPPPGVVSGGTCDTTSPV